MENQSLKAPAFLHEQEQDLLNAANYVSSKLHHIIVHDPLC